MGHPDPTNDIDPYVRALLVLEKPPRIRVGGYKPPEGRFERRYITAQYMREFYNDLDKSKQIRKSIRSKSRQGNDDDEDVFARLEGDELTRAWAKARMDTLYQRAETKWDSANGHLVEQRRARLRAQLEEQWRVKGLDGSNEAPDNSSPFRRRQSDAPLAEQFSAKALFGKHVADPREVHALRQAMYKSIQGSVRDLSAPEFVYYEDPSYGAFEILVGEDGTIPAAATDERYADPVAHETVQNRLRRVSLRNHGKALVASEQGREATVFLKGATGLSADNARRVLAERIGQRMAQQAEDELSPTAAASGKAQTRLRAPHEEHLDHPCEKYYR